MVRKTKLCEFEIHIGQSLLDELQELTLKLPHSDINSEQLGEMVDFMDEIKFKMRNHWFKHRQVEVIDQYLKFDEIIKFVRDLQNKRDVASL